MPKLAEELRNLSVDELKKQMLDLSKELYDLRCERSVTKNVEKPHLFREKRRQRARIMTILQEKNQQV